MTKNTKDYKACPVETTLKLIQGKWKVVIMFRLRDEPKRFNQLTQLLPEITQRMLTKQLRELEESGLVNRDVFAEVPVKVIYSLTPLADSLIPLMLSIKEWGGTYLASKNK
ncbi:MAG: helix-turn-helix transcriptional regulator [Kangiellaceae bacterium]|nr:helix-turn-helix transcriptional regulator [Kangiellaceae bacterium]